MYLSKSLGAFSTQVGTISTANPSVVTITSSVIDTQRRISLVTSSAAADLSGVSFTITGTQDGGNVIRETILGSSTSTTAWTTTQDFKTVTSIAISCAQMNLPVAIQTTSVGGTPWVAVNTCVDPTNIGFQLTFNTTRTPMSGVLEYSFDNPPGQGAQNSLSSFGLPTPFTSTSISTAANTTSQGVCSVPIACWRMTLTSTSTAGTTTTSSLKAYLTAIQTGLGSAL